MFCIQCGVELADSESVCPLCGLRVYHPDVEPKPSFPTFPAVPPAKKQINAKGIRSFITLLCLLVCGILLLCNGIIHHTVSWSLYAIGGIGLAYLLVMLPGWFSHPNPVVFLLIDFAGILSYLLLVDRMTGGRWFLSFVFPCFGGLALMITATVALCRYVRRGYLFIFSGTFIAIGCFMLLIEFMGHVTFGGNGFVWSLYPLIVFCAIGLMLLIIALWPGLREALRKKLFI